MNARATAAARVRRQPHLDRDERVSSVEQASERAQLSREWLGDDLVGIALDGREWGDVDRIRVRRIARIPPRRAREIFRECPLALECALADGERDLIADGSEVGALVTDVGAPFGDR